MKKKLETIVCDYGYKMEEYRTIRSHNKRGIWWFSDGSKQYILKRINKSTPFSLYIHHALVQKNVPLPRVHMTKAGDLYVKDHDEMYAIFDFLAGIKPKKKLPNWKILTKSLCDFHMKAREISVPSSIESISKWPSVEDWIKDKEHQIRFIHRHKNDPLFQNKDEFKKLFTEMIEQGKRSIGQCEKAPFTEYVKENKRMKQVCHGDYGETANSLMDKKKHFIIDLDEAYYGLPFNDLSHFLRKSVVKPDLTKHILQWYLNKEHTPVEEQTLKADLMFPHLFHYGLKKRVLRGRRTNEVFNFLSEAAKYDRRRMNETSR